jgi:hypothetical protein
LLSGCVRFRAVGQIVLSGSFVHTALCWIAFCRFFINDIAIGYRFAQENVGHAGSSLREAQDLLPIRDASFARDESSFRGSHVCYFIQCAISSCTLVRYVSLDVCSSRPRVCYGTHFLSRSPCCYS